MKFRGFKTNVSDLIENFKPISELERYLNISNFALRSIFYPEDGENISTLGELTSYHTLHSIRLKMLCHPTGREILHEKPRIRSNIVNFEHLSSLPQNTFGAQYMKYMNNFEFHPDERPIAKHIPDIELSYIFQRYKEIHDFLHLILQKDTDVQSEIEVKWFEFAQLGLASTSLASIFGSLALPDIESKKQVLFETGPSLYKLGLSSKFCMNVYYEKHFEEDLESFRTWFLSNNEWNLQSVETCFRSLY